MSRKVWVILLLVGLAVYVGYIISILRPYFVRIDAEVLWELEPSVDVAQLHIGDGGTIYASGTNGLLVISTAGEELYYKPDNPTGFSYGYDENSEDVLFTCEVVWVDQQKYAQQQPGTQYNQPGPYRPQPYVPPEDDPAVDDPHLEHAAEFGTMFHADLTAVDCTGEVLFTRHIGLDGYVSNLWCNGGYVYFMDSISNIHCFSEDGEKQWENNYPALVDFNKGGDGRLFLNIGSDILATTPDGEELWRTSLGINANVDNWRNWSEAAGSLCVLHDYDNVTLIKPDGTIGWTHRLWSSGSIFGGYDYSEPAIKLLDDGSVYALDHDAVLWHIDAVGNVDWRFKVGNSPEGFAVGDDGMAYLQSAQRGLLALSPRGKLMWRDPKLGHGFSRPETGPGGRLYLMNQSVLTAVQITAGP